MRYIIATFILPQRIKLMKKEAFYLFKTNPIAHNHPFQNSLSRLLYCMASEI